MSLGIYAKGKIGGGKPVTPASLRSFIERYSSDAMTGLLSFIESEVHLEASFHPRAESVYLSPRDGELFLAVKTDAIGPGYHAYMTELIETMAKAFNIEWGWDFPEEFQYYGDETGYYEHRDFEKLQQAMLNHLQDIAASTIDEGQTRAMIGMPYEYPRLLTDYFAMSPLNIWDKEWFEKVSKATHEELLNYGDQFYIWWNKESDSLFFKNSGIAILNVDCPWHFPNDDGEKRVFSTIDACFEQVRKVNPFLELPESDWEAVKNILSDSAEADIPDSPYGYRKHDMTHDLANGWQIILPGSMHHYIDVDTHVHYDDTMVIRSLSYMTMEQTNDAEFAEKFFDNNENIESAGTEIFYSSTEIHGKAIVYYVIDPELESEYWVLQGVKVIGNDFLVSTVSFNTQDEKEYALEVWNSLARAKWTQL